MQGRVVVNARPATQRVPFLPLLSNSPSPKKGLTNKQMSFMSVEERRISAAVSGWHKLAHIIPGRKTDTLDRGLLQPGKDNTKKNSSHP